MELVGLSCSVKSFATVLVTVETLSFKFYYPVAISFDFQFNNTMWAGKCIYIWNNRLVLAINEHQDQ
jgi:hypothetical protein